MARLKLTLRGIRKVHTNPKRNRIPLTADMMYRLVDKLQQGTLGKYEDALLTAAVCLGFFGALRCSEFTGADCGVVLGDIAFMHDEKLDRNYVLLNLRVSKTDPYRLGCKIFLYETGYTLCPYQSLLLYCNLRGTSPQDKPLFCHQDGSTMTRESFLKMLHLGLIAANIPTEGISGHSLRKGFATTAAAVNVQDNLICTMGRWTSDCYKLYISTPRAAIADAQQAIAEHVM